MSRKEYHRAYYWAHISERRASARASRRKARTVAAIIKIVSDAVTEARNDKPPVRGLDGLHGAIYFAHRVVSEDRVVRCTTSVKHSPSSAVLVGETTRRTDLNSDRGGGPLNAQRVVGKREPQQGNL